MADAHRGDPRRPHRLVAAAAKLLAEGGPDGVSVRRVAAEIGTSTMAVYTHFGGKPELLRAVSVEGFRHLAARLAEVEPTDDPVADIAALARAYRRSALDDPHLFAAMFGRNVAEVMATDDERVEALTTFIDPGRRRPAQPSTPAASRPGTGRPARPWSCGPASTASAASSSGPGWPTPPRPPAPSPPWAARMAVGAGDDPALAAASIPGPGLATARARPGPGRDEEGPGALLRPCVRAVVDQTLASLARGRLVVDDLLERGAGRDLGVLLGLGLDRLTGLRVAGDAGLALALLELEEAGQDDRVALLDGGRTVSSKALMTAAAVVLSVPAWAAT